VHAGGDLIKGEMELRRRLSEKDLIEIGPRARGTMHALQAGCRTVSSTSSAAPRGVYELFAEGLESYCGKLLNIADSQRGDADFNATSAHGRPYLSSRPAVGSRYLDARGAT
jgi:hypothetical protein